MPAPFTSRWQSFRPGADQNRTDATDRRGLSGPSVSCGSPSDGEPATLRTPSQLVGDLAEAIHAHCTACRACRVERFTSETRGSLCPAGMTLWRAYREARRGLDTPSTEVHPVTRAAGPEVPGVVNG